MTNTSSLQANFEREKNIKAATITLLFCALLFMVFYFLHWALPQTPPPIAETGIEVNLGNSETGSGDIAPLTPGDPAKDAAPDNAVTPISEPSTTQQTVNADPNETNDVPVINNPITKAALPSKQLNTPPVNKTKTANAVTPTIPIPKPKALLGKYDGGTGTGGNGADSYNGVKNQGVAGGTGDQGKPNGKPNGDSYVGNSPSGNKSGVAIRAGLKGRKINKYPNFEDDFNEPGKVAVDITVDNTGKVTQVNINPKGTTTPNKNMWNIALRKARELILNPATEESETGTIVFNFRLREE